MENENVVPAQPVVAPTQPVEEGIDWKGMLSGSFVKLVNGEPKRLTLRNWKPQTKFKDDKTNEIRPGVVFEVWAEDSFAYDETTKKEWTVTAIKALLKLRPIVEKAEAAGKKEITINVVRAGEGKATVYDIKEALI